MILRFVVVVSLMAVAAMGCAREPSRSPTATTASDAPASQATATAVPAMTSTPQPRVIAASFLLDVQTPAEGEIVVTQPSVEVRGKTVLDAVVTINGEVVPIDASGEFSANVELEPGPNSVTIVASDFQGNEQARVLTVIYVP